MARALYVILCCAAMAGFVALIRWFITGINDQFGHGFAAGALFSALLFGTWMWLNNKGHFDHL